MINKVNSETHNKATMAIETLRWCCFCAECPRMPWNSAHLSSLENQWQSRTGASDNDRFVRQSNLQIEKQTLIYTPHIRNSLTGCSCRPTEDSLYMKYILLILLHFKKLQFSRLTNFHRQLVYCVSFWMC